MRDRNSSYSSHCSLISTPTISLFIISVQFASSIYLKCDSRPQAAVPVFCVLHSPFHPGKQKLYNLFSVVQTGEDSHVWFGELPGNNFKCLSKVYSDCLDLEVRQET